MGALIRIVLSFGARWWPVLITALKDGIFWLWLVMWKWPLIKFGIVMAMVVAIIAAIPWPAWIATISGLWSGLPPGLIWLMGVFMVSQGLAMVVSAWGLRFILRWVRAAISAA